MQNAVPASTNRLLRMFMFLNSLFAIRQSINQRSIDWVYSPTVIGCSSVKATVFLCIPVDAELLDICIFSYVSAQGLK